MIFKLLKLRLKILFWKITGKVKTIKTRLKLTLSKGNPENVLLIYPMDEPSFRVAYFTFRNLSQQSNQNMKFTLLINRKYKNTLHLHAGERIYIKNVSTSSILQNEKQILKKLKNTRYDIVVDLNPIFHVGISRLVSLLDSEIKVGFTSYFSDQFYNVQLDISNSGVMENGFKKVNRILAQ